MDAFPEDFGRDSIASILAAKKAEKNSQQDDLLKTVRQDVHARIVNDARRLSNCTEFSVPSQLDDAHLRQLVRELCARFPGDVWFYHVVHYADVEEWKLIKDEKNPPLSDKYRVRLRSTATK